MTRVIGHRGAAGLAPENTLHAFQTALEYDVDAVEFDVRRTADGVLVVVHDATVDRTTDGTGAVTDLTAEAIRSLDAGDGESVPTVDEVLDRLAPTDVTLQVELKERSVGEDVIDALEKRELLERSVLTSFDETAIEAVADAPTERAHLTSSFGPDAVERAVSLEVEYVGTSVEHASQSTVRLAHDAGLRIAFWGVDTEAQIRTVAATGADVISTDRPDRTARILGDE